MMSVFRLDAMQPLQRFFARPAGSSGSTRTQTTNAYRIGLAIIAGLTAWLLLWLAYHWGLRPGWIRRLPPLAVELMTLAEAAGSFTLAFLWAALAFRRWRRLQRDVERGPVPTVEDLYALSPKAFERYVAGLFRRKGYKVIVRGRSGDHGVDLELTGPMGRRAIVQCKRYQNTVGEDVVRELFGTLIHEGAIHAFLVTTADISDAATVWARGKPITLIDGRTLEQIAAALQRRSSNKG